MDLWSGGSKFQFLKPQWGSGPNFKLVKAELDDVITRWISQNNQEIVSIVSAQPDYDTEATAETASAVRKSYGALVNMDLEEDQDMARMKAKVVVQEIKREVINTSLEDISSKYDKI